MCKSEVCLKWHQALPHFVFELFCTIHYLTCMEGMNINILLAGKGFVQVIPEDEQSVIDNVWQPRIYAWSITTRL